MMDETKLRVLLIEDDSRLANLTQTYLNKRGLDVVVAADGASGIEVARQGNADVVLLDLMLPGVSGHEVCRAIRRFSDVPIIMVTALGDENDVVVGLEMGADDYVTKPFSSPELLARIRAAARRYQGSCSPTSPCLEIGPLTIDVGAMHARLNEQTLELTSFEFALLRVLAEHAGRVLSREQLLDLTRGNNDESIDRTIDGHISRLRKKLLDDSRQPRLLKTIRGAGYMLVRSSTP